MSDQLGVPGDASGQTIAGRYRVLGRLGSGAMADVYRAHDETLDRDVAVKMFRAVMDGTADTAGSARRELELQALAQLSHPNLITLFDGSVSDEPAFLALELVEGPNLAQLLRDGPLPEPQVRQLGAQIADALAYVHERGMVHRDVKPANILLGRDSAGDPATVRARLSDFGIVRLVDSAQVTAADLTVGTAYYLAPEQARSAAVGPSADVYSLGLVLLEALTGVRAFEGAIHEVLAARLTDDPAIPGGLPSPWPGLLASMTARDPETRPIAADVARTLRATATSVPGAAALAAVPAAAAGAAPAAPVAATAPTAALTDAPAAGLAAPAAGLVAAAAGAPTPSFPPPGVPAATSRHRHRAPGPESDEAGGRMHVTGMLIAAAVFIAIIAGAGWFLFKPASGSAPGSGPQLPSGRHSTPAAAGTTSRSGRRGGAHAVPVADESSTSSDKPGPGVGPGATPPGHRKPPGAHHGPGGPKGPKPGGPTRPGGHAPPTSTAPATSPPASSPDTSASSPSSSASSPSSSASSAASSAATSAESSRTNPHVSSSPTE